MFGACCYVGAGVLSLVLGTILTAMRVSPVGVLRSISTGYINIVRNTPLTLVVLFCSFGLCQTLGFQLVQLRTMPTNCGLSSGCLPSDL